MRIERRFLGTRIRVIFNRSEVRKFACTVLESNLGFDPATFTNEIYCYLGLLTSSTLDPTVFYIESKHLEDEARKYAQKFAVSLPTNASCRIGLDQLGQIAGVTFQYFTLQSVEYEGEIDG